jgi:hypothetical protein|tara:strand:+ start:51 stop:365 length:315 start_codon:yes stop_codon:yes gene_type:complete
MAAKKLEDQSKYDAYDMDGDGIVSDSEMAKAKEIRETEDALRKHLAQLRMARWTLIGMGVFTATMFFIPLDRVTALSDISNLFYISGAGIVGAFMGATAWMGRK